MEIFKLANHSEQTAFLNRFTNISPTDLNTNEQTAIISLATQVLGLRHQKGKSFTNPQDTKTFFQLELAEYLNEVFAVLFLDNQHRFIAFEKMFQGIIFGATVYPRVIAQRTLTLNAAALILTHNHPSGFAQPSSADTAITNKVKQALALIDVRVLDHIIVSTEGTYSMAENGRM